VGFFSCIPLKTAEGEKNDNTILLSVFRRRMKGTHLYSHMQILTYCVLQAERWDFFIFRQFFQCVGVSQRLLAGTEFDAGVHLLLCKRETGPETSGPTVKS